MPTVHLIIKGKVQGVFYRATAKDVADSLGISGWVRNTDAGEVEARATGSEAQLQAFEEWCRKGPSRAVVTGVDVHPMPDERFDGFRVKR